MIRLQVKEKEAFRNYEFSFDQTSRDGVLVAAEKFELEERLSQALSVLKPLPCSLPSGDREFLAALLAATAPLKPRDFPQNSAVCVQTDEQSIPWEMVFPERFVGRYGAEDMPPGRVAEAGNVAAVCLMHPDVFPWCESELAAFSEIGAVRLDSGLDLLLDCPAGLAYLAVGVDQSGALCMPDPISVERWLPRQLNQPRTVPSVLVLRLLEGLSDSLFGVADRTAKAFLKLGIQSVVTTFWEPDPQTFPAALSAFCQALKKSGAMTAFAALRSELSPADSYLSRFAVGFYGNPELKPAEIVPRQFGSKLSATTVARLGKPDFRIRIVAGPEKGRVIPIYAQALHQGKRLVVGSPGLKRCQIEIEDAKLSNEAVSIELEDDVLYLTSLCPTPDAVRIEGLPVYKRVPLRKSLTVETGETKFVVELGTLDKPEPADQGVEKGRFHLILSSGPPEDRHLDFALSDVSTMVGREGSFPLHDPTVSRQHFLVLERDGAHHVSTLGQAQVVLNGVVVEREAQLRHSDLLQLSEQTTLQYVDVHKL